VLLVLSSPAWGWEFSYNVSVDAHSPRFSLPSEDLTFVHNGQRGNVRYAVTSFDAPFSGLYTFTSVGLSSWDNFLILYRGAFNPSTPLVNAVVASDFNPTLGSAGFTAVLTGGEQYFVVTSAAFNSSGTFQATTTVTGVPEPSTWATLATGLLACWHFHKRRKPSP